MRFNPKTTFEFFRDAIAQKEKDAMHFDRAGAVADAARIMGELKSLDFSAATTRERSQLEARRAAALNSFYAVKRTNFVRFNDFKDLSSGGGFPHDQ